jgi:hypothetical protein
MVCWRHRLNRRSRHVSPTSSSRSLGSVGSKIRLGSPADRFSTCYQSPTRVAMRVVREEAEPAVKLTFSARHDVSQPSSYFLG